MSLADHHRWWHGENDNDEPILDLNSDNKSVISSLLLHLGVVFVVALWPISSIVQDQLTISVPQDEEVEPEIDEFEMTVDLTLNEEEVKEVGVASMGTVVEAAEMAMGDVLIMPEPSELIDVPSEVSGVNVVMNDVFSNSDSDKLFEDLAGVKGSVVNAHGDRGSVDRITQEILARLESSDVLVVWLMDASESLRPRREQIISHFSRVYDELDELAGDRGDTLLTSVASFGRGMKVMTEEPTADRKEILESVRNIKAEESGVENVFTAVKGIANTYADLAKSGRKVMLVVVTDERGNDESAVDEAITLVQRQEMAVYVIGPVAPFARDVIKVKWTDPDTRENHYLPVDLGPETAYVEHARLAVWRDGPAVDPVSSGFGPYGLTRITHANGGLYLLTDDKAISGPSFDVQHLSRYRPDYVSYKEYEKAADKNALRLAVLRTTQASNELIKEPLPRTFLASGIQFEIKPVKKQIDKMADILNRGLTELAGAEKERSKEASPRWQAHYDLMMGRLLANRVRCFSSAKLIDDMYANPKLPEDGTKNAWALAAPDSIETAGSTLPPEVKKDAESAREHLQRVVEEHADTPWAVIAQAELEFPLTFQWQEAFKEPPDGVPLPWDKKPWEALTDAEKEAKVAFDKKKAARAKRKKEIAEKKGGGEKKPPPNL